MLVLSYDYSTFIYLQETGKDKCESFKIILTKKIYCIIDNEMLELTIRVCVIYRNYERRKVEGKKNKLYYLRL